MHPSELKSLSKFLSLILRHEPKRIGLTLDDAGWAGIDALLERAAASGRPMTRQQLEAVVETSDKKRFAISEDGLRIRANQGHSIDVDLGLLPAAPPEVLYHGTATRFLESILATGLGKRQRHHVHLTDDLAVARSVGQRYGVVVVLTVDAARMHAEGHTFFRSENGVWLTDAVPAGYLSVDF
ncbi:RNA 2'-phosphotransferase [Ralstonia flaminis]|jgi:putative RNA 2'-phosphotransferase|uniref:Probable RNA 2'-phosphotransferase n=1 Tax=Ralstonia flaminis TaxID=3058597 RepID=A0ABN9JFD0_9RALS|nr:RNA 2'-phosphotransferase [Ralstonia sp. LMG 18101]CAJ0809951.1 putative RNA 2'-phosphotransferase [Ralstonia sp. LMG 18101]